MTLPFQPELWGIKINVHLILEYLAFFVAYQYYRKLRDPLKDPISSNNRLSIILGASIGALVGSRLIGILENPLADFSKYSLLQIFNAKTIMGGLFGGLLGVEIAKRIIGERQRSGDLFTLPIIAGIFIGRVGCFLAGTSEFTYGIPTDLFTGMDLGDGLTRHPLALYELLFLLLLFLFLFRLDTLRLTRSGDLFQLFMIAYFGLRFFLEFLKPNVFLLAGLSTIQWLCVLCWIYYYRLIFRIFKYALSSLHLL
ncbi:MAG: prolipoprotein diacylglyceryl transferase [Cyclobacteriaceae bacterium]|nr:prolipoprotein diacylglyceryl transferase [Cyclobacteriaceae bacterium]